MKISQLEVSGLNNSQRSTKVSFNKDINIITGRNGSGKTTLLKLLWYCVSANIERAIREVPFTQATITTSKYTLKIAKSDSKKREIVHILVSAPTGEVLLDKKEPVGRDEVVEEANHLTVDHLDTSIFFPTFRRIEGGFSMTDEGRFRSRRVIRSHDEFIVREEAPGSAIQDALEMHANMLSVANHKFVSSISTADIKQLVAKKHADATSRVNDFSKSLSEKIFSEIRNYRQKQSSRGDALKDAVSTLDKIDKDIASLEDIRNESFKSLSVLSEMVTTIFHHKGIRLNTRIALGDVDESINSDLLSAGEKQMLSFLCYNALYSHCPFFIDEPELSLHVDWQRILLDTLVEQGTHNQLFIATHSPFIYTQYEDKEIMISNDRGDNGA